MNKKFIRDKQILNIHKLKINDLIQFTESNKHNIRLGKSKWKESINYGYNKNRFLAPLGNNDWVNNIIPYKVLSLNPIKVLRLIDNEIFRLPKENKNYSFYLFYLKEVD